MIDKTEIREEASSKKDGTTGGKRPVCVGCTKEFLPEKNGVLVCEHANFGPYKIWSADLWKCPNCGSEIIVGFGYNSVSEHFQDDFQDWLKKVEYNFY